MCLFQWLSFFFACTVLDFRLLQFTLRGEKPVLKTDIKRDFEIKFLFWIYIESKESACIKHSHTRIYIQMHTSTTRIYSKVNRITSRFGR